MDFETGGPTRPCVDGRPTVRHHDSRPGTMDDRVRSVLLRPRCGLQGRESRVLRSRAARYRIRYPWERLPDVSEVDPTWLSPEPRRPCTSDLGTASPPTSTPHAGTARS